MNISTMPGRRYFAWKLLVYFMALWPWLVSYNPLDPSPQYYPYDTIIGSEPVQDLILSVTFLVGVAFLKRTYVRLETAVETLKNLTDDQKREVLG